MPGGCAVIIQLASRVVSLSVKSVGFALALPALLLMFVAERLDDFADDLWDRWT